MYDLAMYDLAMYEARAEMNECKVLRYDIDLLFREIAAWDTASDEDALKIERMLVEPEWIARKDVVCPNAEILRILKSLDEER